MNAINSNDNVYLSNDQLNAGYNVNSSSFSFSGSDLLQGDSVFSGGLMTLYMFMQMLSDQANGKYAAMNEASENSRQAQEYSTVIDKLIADLVAKGDKGAKVPLPQEIIAYIVENHIEIPGMVFTYSTSENGAITAGDMNCDQGNLNAIKSAFENIANRASDFVSSSQLQLQKLMQTYNVSVSLINSLQTMLADMNKTIAQGIR